jgi:hypothetical protein
MPRMESLENMNHAERADLCNHIDRLMVEKQNSERAELREKMTAMAKSHGLSIDELFGNKGRRKGNGSVAVKYRDPKNSSTLGLGEVVWLDGWFAALNGATAKKEDFLI